MGFRTDCQHCHAFHRPSDARHPAFHRNFHLGADQRLENLHAVFRIMLQSVPEDIPVDELTRKLTEIKGIRSIHDMHLWSLDGESHVMTLHAVTSGTNFHQLKEEIQAVARQYHIIHTTIEFEEPGEKCLCDTSLPE